MFDETDFRWKSAACGREFRFAQMWQEPTVPPQTPRGLRPQTASPTAAAGIPLRSNVVGTCGSPTNTPWPAATDGSADRCGGNSASLKCGRNLRFPHKRPLPDCGGAGWKSRMPFCWAGLAVDGSWLLWEGPPLRPNAAGTCGSPTNAPSLTVEREWAAKRSERFSLLNKKARLRSCLFLRFQLPGRRHLRPPPRLCRRRLPPGSAQPAHPV